MFTPLSFPELLGRFALACAILTPVLVVLGQIFLRVTGVPAAYPPLTPLPLISGAIGGSLLSAVGYGLLATVLKDQRRLWTALIALALLLLVASFNLPWRLSHTRSARFAGVTVSAQVAQAMLHCVVVGTNLAVLLRR